MDRLLEALKRIDDQPSPTAVEPLSEAELREVERLAPQFGGSLVGATASSSLMASDVDEADLFSSEQILLEATLGEAELVEAACAPWIELEGISSSDPSEVWDAIAPQIGELESTDLSSSSDELNLDSDTVFKELTEQLEAVEESLAEEESEAQESLPAVESEIEEEEEVPEEPEQSKAVEPCWEWVEQPYLELLNRITEHRSPGISQAIAITSVDDLPDRELTVAGLAKAYAVTSGERVLVVSANRQSHKIAEQLGVEAGQGTKSDSTLDGTELEKIMPTLHGQADFLSLEDLFPSDLSGHVASVDPMLITRWRGHYSLILLDTGPWGGELVFPLARQCDATYVLLGLGVTLQETAVDAITRMKRGGIRVAGCVLTGSRSSETY